MRNVQKNQQQQQQKYQQQQQQKTKTKQNKQASKNVTLQSTLHIFCKPRGVNRYRWVDILLLNPFSIELMRSTTYRALLVGISVNKKKDEDE